jgi:AbrB family transcriptional regulator (stage V sporulation protein T)
MEMCKMKATGIVRRIDDLGRVVIPKEIRRTLHIKEGDPLEIYTDYDGGVVFKRYLPMQGISDIANGYAEVLSKTLRRPVAIVDRHVIVTAVGNKTSELIDQDVTGGVEEVIQSRKECFFTGTDRALRATANSQFTVSVLVPVISDSDVAGAILVLATGENIEGSEEMLRLTKIVADLMEKQL